MDTLTWLKLVHFLGMILWFGPNLLCHGPLARPLRAEDANTRTLAATMIRQVHTRYMVPGMALSLVAGFWMIHSFFGLSAGYLHAKMTTGVIAALCTLLAVAQTRKILNLASAKVTPETDLRWRATTAAWRRNQMLISTLLLLTFLAALAKRVG